MTTKKKIATGILTLVCGVMLLFAFEVFMMANSGRLMPLMEENIGKTTAEISNYSPELMSLMFTPIKATSALIFSLSIGILIMLYGPFRKNMKWASTSIFTILLVWLSAALLIYSSQPNAPWQVWLVLLLLVIIAFLLDLADKRKPGKHP